MSFDLNIDATTAFLPLANATQCARGSVVILPLNQSIRLGVQPGARRRSSLSGVRTRKGETLRARRLPLLGPDRHWNRRAFLAVVFLIPFKPRQQHTSEHRIHHGSAPRAPPHGPFVVAATIFRVSERADERRQLTKVLVREDSLMVGFYHLVQVIDCL